MAGKTRAEDIKVPTTGRKSDMIDKLFESEPNLFFVNFIAVEPQCVIWRFFPQIIYLRVLLFSNFQTDWGCVILNFYTKIGLSYNIQFYKTVVRSIDISYWSYLKKY